MGRRCYQSRAGTPGRVAGGVGRAVGSPFPVRTAGLFPNLPLSASSRPGEAPGCLTVVPRCADRRACRAGRAPAGTQPSAPGLPARSFWESGGGPGAAHLCAPVSAPAGFFSLSGVSVPVACPCGPAASRILLGDSCLPPFPPLGLSLITFFLIMNF